jgi:hypothetical protein
VFRRQGTGGDAAWKDRSSVSEEIATEIQTRCDIEGAAVPAEHIRDSSPVTPVRTDNLRCGSLESWLTMKTRSPALMIALKVLKSM